MAKMITYPRSGANYLQTLIFNKTGEHIVYSHTIDLENSDNSVIISIARDPFDSIHSHMTMKKHYYPEESFSNLYTNHYNDIYNFSYENAGIVIDYNDLVQKPQVVVDRVCQMLGLKETLVHEPWALADNKENDYLVSSRTSKEYSNKHFNVEDVNACYDAYHNLLSKAIDLTQLSY
jgi:hypothetical protein